MDGWVSCDISEDERTEGELEVSPPKGSEALSPTPPGRGLEGGVEGASISPKKALSSG